MTWNYNHTSRLYECPVSDAFLFVNPHLERILEDEGWLACKGVAVSMVYQEAEWTCHERIEYNTDTKAYQVGTRKWRATEEGLEFCRYQDVAIHLLQHEKALKEKGMPQRTQQNIVDLFKEVKRIVN